MKKKRLKCFISALAAGIVCAGIVNVHADSVKTLMIDVSFDNDSRELSFAGKVADSPNEFLIVRLKPYSENEDFSNKSMSENDYVITRTLMSDGDGNIDTKIILPEKFLGRRYSYIFSSSTEEQRGVFAAVNKGNLVSIAEKASSADENEMVSLLKDEVPLTGIDNGDAGKDFEFMAKMLVNTRPQIGYTSESFTKDYMVSEGLVYVRSGSITVAEYFNRYAAYFENDYLSSYKELSAKAAEYIDESLKTIIPNERFESIYNKLVFVAGARTSESYSKLRKLVLEYSKENNIEMLVYNSLNNDYYEDNVFKDLYDKAPSLDSVEAIFNQIETDAAKYKNKKSNSGGSSSGGGGGSYSIGKKPVTDPSAQKPVDNKSDFNDIESHWAKVYINKIEAAGLINGYGDGSFRPDNNITRAEMAKIIVLFMKDETSHDNVFADVTEEMWYFPYISTAYKKGYIKGTGQGFNPRAEITREDACVIIYNAVKSRLKNENKDAAVFNDEAEISAYAKTAVEELKKRGIINGYQSLFAPKSSMTRGELAAVLSNLLEATE